MKPLAVTLQYEGQSIHLTEGVGYPIYGLPLESPYVDDIQHCLVPEHPRQTCKKFDSEKWLKLIREILPALHRTLSSHSAEISGEIQGYTYQLA